MLGKFILSWDSISLWGGYIRGSKLIVIDKRDQRGHEPLTTEPETVVVTNQEH